MATDRVQVAYLGRRANEMKSRIEAMRKIVRESELAKRKGAGLHLLLAERFIASAVELLRPDLDRMREEVEQDHRRALRRKG